MTDTSIHLFEDYSLDLVRGCLTRGRVPIHLRRQSYEVLKYLVENRGRLISKDELIEDVWQGRAVTDGSLGKCIEEVREALGEESRKYVRTERGRGYIFEPETTTQTPQVVHSQLDVARVLAEDDEYSSPVSVRSAQKAKDRTRSAALIISAIAIASAAVTLIYFKYFSVRSQQIHSVAVLPFANATDEASTEYVSDGLSESLIDELAKLPDLKVIARSSSFNYKGREVDPQEVARALGVQGLVTGRVVQRDDNLVVSIELVDARDRTRVWGEQYTRSVAELQQLPDEIARAIAEKLRLRLSVAQERQPLKHAPSNRQAYEFYLNGLFHWNQGSNEGIKKSLDYFNQAVLLDPNFALAWACLSRANSNLGGNSLSNPKDTQVKARAAAERALELDETLADAHLALGRIRRTEWNWVGAEQEYKRAIELSPSFALAHAEYAAFLSMMMRHTEALNEINRARELDPMSVRLRIWEAFLLHLARRSNEGIALIQETLKGSRPTTGTHRSLGFMYAATGSYEQAIGEFREVISINGEGSGDLCYLAATLALAGKKNEALQIVDRLNRSKEYVSPTELATVHARLNDTESAITLLQKAYAEHDLQLETLNVDPYFDNLRSDPRFQELVRRVGLPSIEER